MSKILVAAVVTLVISPSAAAQSVPDGGPDPAAVRVRIGPLWLNPRIQLTNLGVDTNVFNEAEDQQPKKDFTLTVTPSTDVWLRIGRSWLQANVKEDLVWFQKYASERSANNSYAVRWHMPLNRLIVNLSPKYVSTRERPGFEIDARSQRTEYELRAIVEVRALSKTSLGISGSRTKVNFDKDAVFLGNSLHAELNRTTTSAGIFVRHHLTPLTDISLNVGQVQDRFEFSQLRDSNSTEVGATVTFDPHALVKGSATFGYRNFHPLSAGLPDYVGSTASGNLSYTLLGITRFGVQFRRDVGYSYDVGQPYYLETGVTASVAQQVFGPIDVVVRGGRSRLAYRDRVDAVVAVSNRVDFVHSYGAGIGYHTGKDLRLGFDIDQQRRISDVSRRQYDGLKYGTSVTYGF